MKSYLSLTESRPSGRLKKNPQITGTGKKGPVSGGLPPVCFLMTPQGVLTDAELWLLAAAS